MRTVSRSLAIVEDKERASEQACHANAMAIPVAIHLTLFTLD